MGVTNLFKEVKPLVDKATIKKLVKQHGVRKIALDISCQVHQYLYPFQYLCLDQTQINQIFQKELN